MTSMPASRSARTSTLAPRSWPSRPGLAIRTRIGWVSAVDIKSLARLSAQLTGRDHTLEEDCRPVFILAEIAMQYLDDVQHDVQADQVGERQRPHRMIRAELERLIDRLGRCHAALE